MSKVEIIPLGGIGEFGMNSMGIRYRDEMIVIDAGMGFPEETSYGVDISIPDFSYLEEYKSDISALILTHGHEDHIGALPFFLQKFNVPVYTSKFTAALCDKKLDEHSMLSDVLVHRVKPNDVVKLGNFEIEFIHASHSLVECFSLAIKTPIGTLIHTGDYKIDETPVIGDPYDLKTLKKYGDEGVLALLSDSTNATVEGRTPSENAVYPAFEEIFETCDGRIFISTFSSSVHRLQVVFDVAHEFGRRVCVLGRSMNRNVETAVDFGLLKVPHGLLVNLSDARSLADDEIVFLVTGSQGEPRAVLGNLAGGGYKGLDVGKGDTVILSARIIPGNERSISRLIGNLYKKGANIIEEKRRLVHVSGHASQEDIRIMTETARPKYLIPIHGEYRMLFRHKEFVKNHVAGYDDENIILIENGDVLEIDEFGARISERIELNRTFIDEDAMVEIENETVRERKKMAFGGLVSLFVTFNRADKTLAGEPQISFQGVAGVNSLSQIIEQAQEEICSYIDSLNKVDLNDENILRESLRIHLKRFIQNQTGTKPVIVTTISEV